MSNNKNNGELRISLSSSLFREKPVREFLSTCDSIFTINRGDIRVLKKTFPNANIFFRAKMCVKTVDEIKKQFIPGSAVFFTYSDLLEIKEKEEIEVFVG
jgi:hypothetical protein